MSSTPELLHQLFAATAKRHPERTAILGADGTALSYAEADLRSNRLAVQLRELGVRRDVFVGIEGDRSPEMVLSVLAILKAGGGYVPIDPSQPPPRLEFMLRDAGAKLVLCPRAEPRWLTATEVSTLVVAEEEAKLANTPARAPAIDVDPDDIAYLIYTSGTTGTPRAVVATHRNAHSQVCATLGVDDLNADDRILQRASLAVDPSVWEIFKAFSVGAAVVLTRSPLEDPTPIEEIIERHGVTVAFFIPSLLKAVDALPSCLRYLLVGGEFCSPGLVRRHAPGRRFLNVYGTTETTVYSTVAVCDADNGAPTLGKPIENSLVYVLDEYLEPTPPGVLGEIYIGGKGVARGYHNRPDETERHFANDPFAEAPGARMFRTGDGGRWLSGGNLELVGRVDSQLKIRGNRVEPGEIQAAIEACEGVRAAAVVPKHDVRGMLRLVGYVVGPEGDGEQIAAIRDRLRDTLPAYMVPDAFVTLDELPCTIAGKLDIDALPEARLDADEFVAPEPGVEATLAAIWEEVLSLERVSATDNFFKLGGDSIFGMRILAKARTHGLYFEAQDILEHPTIRRLAAVIDTEMAPAGAQPEKAEEGPVPMLPIQHWFFAQELHDPNHFGLGIEFELDDAANAHHLERALAAVVAHHDALRMRFRQMDGRWHQQLAECVPVEIETHDLSGLPVAEQDAELDVLRLRLVKSVDLQQRPFAAALFDLGSDRPARFRVHVHTLCADTMAMRILEEQLTSLYEGLLAGAEVTLPSTTPYGVWAERLAADAREGAVDDQAERWLSMSEDAEPRLPRDMPDGRNDNASERMVIKRGALPALPKTSLEPMALAAVAQTLAQWARLPVVTVNLMDHGRVSHAPSLDVTRTIGRLSSLYPVRLRPDDRDSADAWLRAAREELAGGRRQGIIHNTLRYLGRPEIKERLAQIHAETLVVNLGPLLEPVTTSSTLRTAGMLDFRRDPKSLRDETFRVYVNSHRTDQYSLIFVYSENLHRRETVEGLVDDCWDNLCALIQRDPDGHG